MSLGDFIVGSQFLGCFWRLRIFQVLRSIFSAPIVYFTTIECVPSTVPIPGEYISVLKAYFYDRDNLDPSLYSCEFSLRDTSGTIFGPYSGQVEKLSDHNYLAQYSLDPSSPMTIGPYDLKVKLIKVP